MEEGPSKEAVHAFASALKDAIVKIYPKADLETLMVPSTITLPPAAGEEKGDLASSVALKLARLLNQNPQEIAELIASRAKPAGYISKFSALNGYVNAFIDQRAYAAGVISGVLEAGDAYGRSAVGKAERVMVEFPSVNPNKQWLVSHLRNALLGDTICNLLCFCSYEVEREDYIDDLGLQMAETLWGWKKLSSRPDKRFDLWLGEQYVEVNRRIAENPGIKDEINALLKKMEETGSPESKTAREVAERCVMAQSETSFVYGVCHDVMIWESDIVRAKLLEKALGTAMEKGILEKPSSGKYNGCTVIKLDNLSRFAKSLEGSREDSKVLVRSNGAATYLAKDFAFHLWKFGVIDAEFRYRRLPVAQPNGKPLLSTAPEGERANFGHAMKAVNVIDASQYHEQLILRLMFSLLGRQDCAENLIHLAYGRVKVAEGGLSTRKGTWQGKERNYTADDLLREVRSKAMEIVGKSEKISNKDSTRDISGSVALAAIKFEFLRIAPEKEITFSWGRALSFEGESGPYCLYTYARASRILEKAGVFVAPKGYAHVSRGRDFELVKLMGAFQEIAEKACREWRPNVVTDYLLDLASVFSKFYEEMPVLKGGEAMAERLAIVAAFRQVIKNALALLGIGIVERM